MYLSTPIGNIEVLEEDYTKLVALSPMIEVQLRNIVLERALVALKRLTESSNGNKQETLIPEV